MLPRNHPDRIQIAFDDHRLVANAGLLLPATLAHHLGLKGLEPALPMLSLKPGEKRRGFVTFKVPEDRRPAQLRFPLIFEGARWPTLDSELTIGPLVVTANALLDPWVREEHEPYGVGPDVVVDVTLTNTGPRHIKAHLDFEFEDQFGSVQAPSISEFPIPDWELLLAPGEEHRSLVPFSLSPGTIATRLYVEAFGAKVPIDLRR